MCKNVHFMWTLKRWTIIQSRIKNITSHILAKLYHVCFSVTSLKTLNLPSSGERGVAMEILKKVSSEVWSGAKERNRNRAHVLSLNWLTEHSLSTHLWLTPKYSVCEPRIQLVAQNPATAPGGVISPPFKSMITNKPITFWLSGNGPVD